MHHFLYKFFVSVPNSLNGRPLTSPPKYPPHNRNASLQGTHNARQVLRRSRWLQARHLQKLGVRCYSLPPAHNTNMKKSEAQPQVSGYSGCLHKCFKTLAEAEDFMQRNQRAQTEVDNLLTESAERLGALCLDPGVRPVSSMPKTEVQSVESTTAVHNEMQREEPKMGDMETTQVRGRARGRGGRPRGWQKPAQNVDISVALRVREQPRRGRGYPRKVSEAP